jgi:hypothetical protein
MVPADPEFRENAVTGKPSCVDLVGRFDFYQAEVD